MVATRQAGRQCQKNHGDKSAATLATELMGQVWQNICASRQCEDGAGNVGVDNAAADEEVGDNDESCLIGGEGVERGEGRLSVQLLLFL